MHSVKSKNQQPTAAMEPRLLQRIHEFLGKIGKPKCDFGALQQLRKNSMNCCFPSPHVWDSVFLGGGKKDKLPCIIIKSANVDKVRGVRCPQIAQIERMTGIGVQEWCKGANSAKGELLFSSVVQVKLIHGH